MDYRKILYDYCKTKLPKPLATVLAMAKLKGSVRRSLLGVALFSAGANSLFISIVIGTFTPLILQSACLLMSLTLFLALITRSFSDDHARTMLRNLKRIFLRLGFTLLNGIVAPVVFVMIASVVSQEPGDWKWGPIMMFVGGFTFVLLLNFLVSMREFFTGLNREVRFNRPLSIL